MIHVCKVHTEHMDKMCSEVMSWAQAYYRFSTRPTGSQEALISNGEMELDWIMVRVYCT